METKELSLIRLTNAEKDLKIFKGSYKSFIADVVAITTFLKASLGENIQTTHRPYPASILENEDCVKFYNSLKFKFFKEEKNCLLKVKFKLNGKISVTLHLTKNELGEDPIWKKIPLEKFVGFLPEICDLFNKYS